MNDFIIYHNRKNNRYGFSTKEYAYNSDTFLNHRTVLLEACFEVAYEVVKELRHEQ